MAPRAQGFFLRMTGYDLELARDLTQDLFMRLWTSRDSYDSGRPFSTWMFSIACNMLKNEYRHRMKRFTIAYTPTLKRFTKSSCFLSAVADFTVTVNSVSRKSGHY